MATETSNFLRKRLKELRNATGLTQEQYAEIAGINYKYYQDIEIGRSCELRISTLEKLSKVYGLKVYQLLSPEFPKVKRTFKNKV